MRKSQALRGRRPPPPIAGSAPALNALVSSEQIRSKQTSEILCTDGLVTDETAALMLQHNHLLTDCDVSLRSDKVEDGLEAFTGRLIVEVSVDCRPQDVQ